MLTRVGDLERRSERQWPPRKKDELRRQLREALKKAIDGERRFGIREDARPELDTRWDEVIAAMEALCG